jgi:hypothetical protein
MGEVILPDPSHVKFIDQISHRLVSEYQKHAKRLKKTGDGVDDRFFFFCFFLGQQFITWCT